MYVGLMNKDSASLTDVGAGQLGTGTNLQGRRTEKSGESFGRTFEKKRLDNVIDNTKRREEFFNSNERKISLKNNEKKLNLKEAVSKSVSDNETEKAVIKFQEFEESNSKELKKIAETETPNESKLEVKEKENFNSENTDKEKEDLTNTSEVITGVIDLNLMIDVFLKNVEELKMNSENKTEELFFEEAENFQEMVENLSLNIKNIMSKEGLKNINFEDIDPVFNEEQSAQLDKILADFKENIDKFNEILNGSNKQESSEIKTMTDSLKVESVEVSKSEENKIKNIMEEMLSEKKTDKSENENQKIFETELKDSKSDKNTENKDQNKQSVIDTKSDIESFTKNEVSETQKATVEEIVQNIEKNQNQVKTFLKTEVFEQVKMNIAKQSIKAGDHSEMIIKLKPEELGKVELKIEVHKDEVIAKFNVASQMVKEAIESNLSDLRNTLKDKGFDVMSFSVDVGNEKKDNSHESGKRSVKASAPLILEENVETVSGMYRMSLDALDKGSTFEHLA